MAFGIIIIGDEILSGRRTDKHLSQVIGLLAARGLSLDWAEYVGDDPARITATLRRTLSGGDVVFSTGGIGATPDDHTRQCAAEALGVPLALHDAAKALIVERMRDMTGHAQPDLALPENQQRLKMGEFPVGAAIIPNPYNKIPGFSVADHHFVPGFPVMAWPMIEWVLDTHYAHLHHVDTRVERSILVFGLAESTIAPLMRQIETTFPTVKAFSLPSVGDAQRGALYARHHIDLGVKGDAVSVEAAFAVLRDGITTLGGEMVEAPSAGKGG
ncbi:damage-inducible protein [Robbsia andropogonis]|uniref:Damage-inducible protein n=1 Tax=Robbsia andropogonis TaxID=28092 RepID=A0A0F5JZB7_9BURK|nr:molybdopterin-binding protein [Robbsia andropogonis]KKB62642.1 damage-inducible protein [Robbsia andropogonis]MCP1120440.1 molybdopterin-binding protein [Robbsia andropogonis]MCP1130311.1 molybdopterin-binding protein [Robbsia andropogonis]